MPWVFGPEGVVAVDAPVVTFAGLLRRLRTEAGLSQEELAQAAGVGARTVSDLERGVALTARKDTARLLAGALNLTGPARASFEAVARGRAAPGVVPAADGGAAGAGGAAAATRALPRDTGSFTGRQPQLRQLTDVVAGSSRPGVVSICAIGGMAGVGKTALAVHAAHQLAPRFPDGQVFLPLHGHTPGQRPVDPADALASLLLTAGVPAGQIPPGLAARTALWRDRLAGKRLLLVLDDAAGSEQVRPLLPGTEGSLVLVTSRRHLTALEDAETLSLDTLPTGEAAELLVRLAARPGLDPGGPAVAEITRLCGYLPLAIGMLARQLHHHPAWTAADLAADLAAARDRLVMMRAENLSVAAAFDLSYEDLTPAQQHLFRRLGLHPGPDIDAYATAALDGTSPAAARRDLEALYDQYLITEPARGRYRLHDLLREHARTLAGTDDPAENDIAIDRLLDYYQHTAGTAGDRLARHSRSRPGLAGGGTSPTAVPALPDYARALAWLRAERANLLACLDEVTRSGQHARVIALTAGLAPLLRQDGPWTDALARHAAACQAAREAGDRQGEAGALLELGDTRLNTGDYPGTGQAIQEALGISRDLGDRRGVANALLDLAYAGLHTGDSQDAAGTLEETLGIYRELEDRRGEANALLTLGVVRRMTGDPWAAAQAFTEALRLYRDLGDWRNQGNALSQLADVRVDTADYPGAVQAFEEALGIFRDLGNRKGAANALFGLGQVRAETGDHAGAARLLEEVLSIYRDIDDKFSEGNALQMLGSVRWKTGDYLGGAQMLDEALGIYRDIGYPQGVAEALNETGTLNRVRGDLDQALTCYRQALDLAREIGSPQDEGRALAGLGRCALADGRMADAETALRQAQEILQRIGAAEAAEVAAELEALPQPRQAGDH